MDLWFSTVVIQEPMGKNGLALCEPDLMCEPAMRFVSSSGEALCKFTEIKNKFAIDSRRMLTGG